MNLKYIISMLLFTSMIVGSATAQDRQLIKQTIDKDWSFKQVRGNNWHPATVPGVVQSDLMANGIIEDPFFRLNERSIQWIDKEDWEYKKTIVADDALLAKENIEILFEGLDTYADVYLNDSCILKANNMFREWRVDIKSILKAGDNELRVYFHSPIKVDMPKFDALHYPIQAGNDQSENGGLFDKKVAVFARKAGYHYGWDWGPRIVTSGIWRPVHLIGWDGAKINNIHYIQQSVNAKEAKILAKIEITADQAADATIQITADGIDKVWSKKIEIKEGINTIETPIRVKDPKLWWSNGLGKAHLYPFTATLKIDDTPVDSHKTNLGLRSLRVVRDKDEAGTSFYFELNGEKVFAKGANYIPQDNLLPRVTDAKYTETVLAAVNANMNMLRVWGGGIYENKIFYDLCDKYGILVWQDFMFSCNTYPMTPELLDNIRVEAVENVVRLRNHPSIAMWCGNNEMHTAWFNWGWMKQYKELGVLDELRKDYKDLFHVLLPEVVEKFDPTTYYWPSSPYGGDPDAKCESGTENWSPNGDAHYWGVWHAKDSIANYNKIRARFFSEYGFQSFPEYESVLKYAPNAEDHDIYSDVMMSHQRGGSHANGLIEWYLLNEYRKPKDFQSFLYMGQLLQGDAIKTAIEAHRRAMPYCMGTLYWQHNDCWPVASWSSRDYYGRWKAQHYFAKKAFDKILLSPIEEDGELNIYVVSDILKKIEGELSLRLMNFKGEILFEDSEKITIPANTSKIQYSMKIQELLKDSPRGEIFLNTQFTPQNSDSSLSNNYFFTRYKDVNFPKANIDVVVNEAKDGGFEITLTSEVFSRGVFMSIDGIDNFFEDNYFDLLPNTPVTIHLSTKLDKSSLTDQLKVVSIADAF